MNRKLFLERLIVVGGGALVAPSVLLQSCKIEPRVWSSLSDRDIDFLNAIGETLLPKTQELLGAEEINIGKYIIDVVDACLSPEDKNTFLNGLVLIDALSVNEFGERFEDLDDNGRYAILKKEQEKALIHKEAQKEGIEPEIHYFSLLKELVLTGYFSSKEVMTEAFDYSPIPGQYAGCIAYDAAHHKIYKG